jgi:hypothetical protein
MSIKIKLSNNLFFRPKFGTKLAENHDQKMKIFCKKMTKNYLMDSDGWDVNSDSELQTLQ